MTNSLPRNPIAQVFWGMRYLAMGLSFVRQHRLWGLWVAAALVNAVLLVLLVAGTLLVAVPWLEDVAAVIAAWDLLGSTIAAALSWMLWAVTIPLLIAVDILILLLVGQLVASPFLEALSERVEYLVLGTEPQPFGMMRLVRTVRMALSDVWWSAMFAAVVYVPIWLLGLIPLVGAMVASTLGFAFAALLVAQEFVGLPMERRLIPYRQRWRVVWANRWLALGFGLASVFLVITPGLNLMLLPVAAVGGSLLYCDLQRAGRIGAGQ